MSAEETDYIVKQVPEALRPVLHRLLEYRTITVASYADGSQRAHTAHWDATSNRMVFRALADPREPRQSSLWAANALYAAAEELWVDARENSGESW